MSQITVSPQDNQAVERRVLSGTSAETIYTCPNDQTAKVLGVNAHNPGTTATVKVSIHDGTDTFDFEAKSIEGGGSHYFDLHAERLREGESIRVTGVSGVHVVLNALESGR